MEQPRRRNRQRAHIPTGRADRVEIISARAAIIGMRDAGMSQNAIARARGVTIKTVKRWIRRWDGEGTLATRPRSGRPRILSPADDQQLIQAVMEGPHISAVDHTQQLQFPCNPETTRRHLNEAGVYCSVTAHKEKLTQANREMRFAFAVRYSQDLFDQQFWKTVIWTDEKSFSTTAAFQRLCWRLPNTRYEPQNIQEVSRSGRCSLSFHGWMWHGGLGDLTRIDGNLTSVKYIEILNRILPSIREKAIPAPNPIRFVHDRSPVHMSRVVRDWFREHPLIEVLEWPSKGCDMNVIENVWAMMVRTWDIHDERNREAIENHAIAEWENIRRVPNYTQRLIDSVPNRLNAVIAANGGWGKY